MQKRQQIENIWTKGIIKHTNQVLGAEYHDAMYYGTRGKM